MQGGIFLFVAVFRQISCFVSVILQRTNHHKGGSGYAGQNRISKRHPDGLLQGDIDHHTASAMRESIDRAAESCLPQKLVMDFSGVSFMDSSGIGLVMGRYRLIRSMGGSLEITGTSARIRTMMKMAGLDLLGI